MWCARTPSQYVGWMVQHAEFWNVTCARVTLIDQATSNSRGPSKPGFQLQYHAAPPPSTTEVFWSAPRMATFVRLEPQSTEVSAVAQASVGQRGFCTTGIGVYGGVASQVVPLDLATVWLQGTGGVLAEKSVVSLSMSWNHSNQSLPSHSLLLQPGRSLPP